MLSELFLRVVKTRKRLCEQILREKEKGRRRGERRIENSARLAYALINLEHQLESSRKRYTWEAKRSALPRAAFYGPNATSPRLKKCF